MSTAPYTLHYAPDNASLIVRLALEELAVRYRTHLVDRSVAAQRTAAHRALHPGGLIPVLETPDGPLFETGAILLWLADRHPGLAPPPDSAARAELLKWLFYLSNSLHPALRMLFYPSIYVGPDIGHQTHLQTQARQNILGHLDILEAHWQQRAAPNLLDLYLGPMLRWLKLYPRTADHGWFDLASFPKLSHMALMLEARPSTHAAQVAEGLGPTPFTAPQPPQPPEGSAL